MPRGFADFVQPYWSGEAWRHIRDYPGADVFDFTYAATATDNRWNHAGEPTLYLASDFNVALGEYSRHINLNRTALGPDTASIRMFYRLGVAVDSLLDLRDIRLCDELQLEDEGDGIRWFFNKNRSRAVAAYLRHVTDAKGLIVPAMTALDDPSRWNLVLFLDKLPADPRAFLSIEEVITVMAIPSS